MFDYVCQVIFIQFIKNGYIIIKSSSLRMEKYREPYHGGAKEGILNLKLHLANPPGFSFFLVLFDFRSDGTPPNKRAYFADWNSVWENPRS